jgi:hypothetical protein
MLPPENDWQDDDYSYDDEGANEDEEEIKYTPTEYWKVFRRNIRYAFQDLNAAVNHAHHECGVDMNEIEAMIKKFDDKLDTKLNEIGKILPNKP